MYSADVLKRALDSRDARFDGLFFVGITTTKIYCRPVCPARVSYHDRRRFFYSAAAAERAGFRPCLRCRPELAPGRAVIDAVPRLASLAAHRIAAGALNGRSVAALAMELRVSERQLRRALERELGVSALELASTQRLLLAKRLLADTSLPVTRVAFASGFQSLRRFNAVFRDRYRMSPSAVRRVAPRHCDLVDADVVRLTLAYRAPLDWQALTNLLGRDATPGVEWIEGARYGRTVSLDGKRGVVFATNGANSHLSVDVSPALVPVLMALLARLRQLFDLDAEPAVVDESLERAGLGRLIRRRRGLRLPGAFDGFEIALRVLLRGPVIGRAAHARATRLLGRVVDELGEPIETGYAALSRLTPSPRCIAEGGVQRLVALGVTPRTASAIVTLAKGAADGTLRLEPGRGAAATRRALLAIDGVGEARATAIEMHALHWPDAFTSSDRALQRVTGVSGARALRTLAERWRPWRAYAALHLWLDDEERRRWVEWQQR